MEHTPGLFDDKGENDPFDSILSNTLGHEGGFTVDHAGTTNKGITQDTFNRYRKSMDLEPRDVKTIREDEVYDIYRSEFYESPKINTLPEKVQGVLFDFGVNSSPDRAIKTLQRTVGATPDGNIGPKTLGAVDAYIEKNGEDGLVNDIINKREGFLKKLIQDKPEKYKKFENGWKNRLNKLREQYGKVMSNMDPFGSPAYADEIPEDQQEYTPGLFDEQEATPDLFNEDKGFTPGLFDEESKKPNNAIEIAKGGLRGLQGVVAGTGGLIDMAGQNIQREAEKRLFIKQEGISDEQRTKSAENLFKIGKKVSEWGKTAKDFWNKASREGIARPDEKMFTGSFMQNPSWTRAATIVSEAVPSLGAATAASAAAGGNPIVGLAFLGSIEGEQTFSEARSAGKSVDDANRFFGMATLGTSVLEALPLTRFLKGGEGKLAKDAFIGAVQEGGEEGLQNLWQNVIAKIGYDKTRSLTEGMVESVIGGAGSGGVIGGLTSGRAAKLDKEIKQAIDSGVPQVAIDAMQETVANQIVANAEEVEKAITTKPVSTDVAEVKDNIARDEQGKPISVNITPEMESALEKSNISEQRRAEIVKLLETPDTATTQRKEAEKKPATSVEAKGEEAPPISLENKPTVEKKGITREIFEPMTAANPTNKWSAQIRKDGWARDEKLFDSEEEARSWADRHNGDLSKEQAGKNVKAVQERQEKTGYVPSPDTIDVEGKAVEDVNQDQKRLEADQPKAEEVKTITEEEASDKGMYRHILRKGSDIEKLITEGFKTGIGPNVVKVWKGKPTTIIQEKYSPKAGDTVVYIPKDQIVDSPNGPKIKPGYKPTKSQIVKIEPKPQDFKTAEEYVASKIKNLNSFLKSRVPEIENINGNFITTKDGNSIEFIVDPSGESVTISHILANKKGTGIGTKLINAVKDFADANFKSVIVKKPYNEKFWNKSGILVDETGNRAKKDINIQNSKNVKSQLTAEWQAAKGKKENTAQEYTSGEQLINTKNPSEKVYFDKIGEYKGEQRAFVSYIANIGGKLRQDTRYVPLDKFNSEYKKGSESKRKEIVRESKKELSKPEVFEQRTTEQIAKDVLAKVQKPLQKQEEVKPIKTIGKIVETGNPLPNKGAFSGFTFGKVKDAFKIFVEGINKVKAGEVTDVIKDGKRVGVIKNLWDDGKKEIDILINYQNAKLIAQKHGAIPADDLVTVINEFEDGVFIKASNKEKNKDKINLIKMTPDGGMFVVGANRINGYAVVTFFEQYDKKKAKKYLDSLKNQGIGFKPTGRAAVPPSITTIESRVPASLSGVSDLTSIEKIAPETDIVKEKEPSKEAEKEEELERERIAGESKAEGGRGRNVQETREQVTPSISSVESKISASSVDDIKFMQAGITPPQQVKKIVNDDIVGVSTFIDPEVERRFQASKGLTVEGLRSRIKTFLSNLGNRITRVYPTLPNRPEYAELRNILSKQQNVRGIANERAIRALDAITAGMGPKKLDLFTRKVILDDLVREAEAGRAIPFGYSQYTEDGGIQTNTEMLRRDKANIDYLVSKNKDIQDAIEKRRELWQAIQSDLVQYNILTEDQIKQDYFRHQVLDYARLKATMGTGKKLRTPTPGYAKRRVGSIADINTDYVEAEFEVMAQALHDIQTAKNIKNIENSSLNIVSQLKEEAKELSKDQDQNVDWHTLIPDGYTTWQPREGNIFYMANSVSDKVLNSALESLDGTGIDPKDLKKVLAVGSTRKEFVLPAEVATTLDNLYTAKNPNAIAEGSKFLTTLWKKWILMNPRRAFKYNYQNFIGDFDAVVAGDPRIVTKFARAYTELYGTMFQGKPMTKEMREYFERGGLSTQMTVNELPELRNLDVFRRLLDNSATKDLQYQADIWRRYWNGIGTLTTFRESIFRYASYLHYRDMFTKGGKVNYGASIKSEIDGISDPLDKAAKVATELLGDYANLTAFGKDMREAVVPFYSWLEINAKRYSRLTRNAFDEGWQKGIKTSATIAGVKGGFFLAKWLVRAAAMTALMALYNHTMFPDEEEELSEYDKNRMHIILGRNPDGSIAILRGQTAFADILEWFGLDAAPSYWKEYTEGKASFADIFGRIPYTDLPAFGLNPTDGKIGLHQAAMKMVRGINPIYKGVAETLSGKSLPVFDDKSWRIEDKTRNLLKSLSLENEYDLITGKPSKGYFRSLQEAFIATNDPEENAYRYIQGEKYKFLETVKGKGGSSDYYSPRSILYREYKKALRYKDEGAVKRIRQQMATQGITAGDLSDSLKRSEPLSGLSQKDRVEFVSMYLSDRDIKVILPKANRYYFNTFRKTP